MADDDNNQTEPQQEQAELETPEAELQPELESIEDKSSDLIALREQLDQAIQETTDLKDQVLRVQAETQNVRRRSERDVENAHKYSLEKFCRELLPIVDNLERALEASDSNNEALKTFSDGVELTLKSCLDVLKKFKVEQLDPVGEPFDPQFHEAMSMVEAPDAEPNSVLNVVQKGYTLHGRLIRAAMVVISKPAPKINEQA